MHKIHTIASMDPNSDGWFSIVQQTWFFFLPSVTSTFCSPMSFWTDVFHHYDEIISLEGPQGHTALQASVQLHRLDRNEPTPFQQLWQKLSYIHSRLGKNPTSWNTLCSVPEKYYPNENIQNSLSLKIWGKISTCKMFLKLTWINDEGLLCKACPILLTILTHYV